ITMAYGKVGPPLGNKNAAKKTDANLWRTAIRRALDAKSKRDGVEALDALAETLIEMCAAKDISALRELGDRLYGKPKQQVNVDGVVERPMVIAIERIVRERALAIPAIEHGPVAAIETIQRKRKESGEEESDALP